MKKRGKARVFICLVCLLLVGKVR